MSKFPSKYFYFFLIIIYIFSYVISYPSQIDQQTKDGIIRNLKYLRKLKISEFKDKISETPKISIIIPIYNGEDFITPLISSIQVQSLKDLEIIFVDDYSQDESYEKILEAQNIDKRIKIFRNKINRGIFYSRFFGALQSKGSYVAFIDCDDLYVHPNLLEEAYKAAVSNNLDLLQFNYAGSYFDGAETYKNLFFSSLDNPINQIIVTPHVKNLFFGKSNSLLGSKVVFDKLYKRSLIDRMADFLGEDLINRHLIIMEDFLMSFGAFRTAENYMLMNIHGIWIWFNNPNTVMNKGYENENDKDSPEEFEYKKIGDYITVWEKMFEFTENNPDDEIFRVNILKILVYPTDSRNSFARSYHYERLINICVNFYHWKHVTNDTKQYLKQYCKETIEKSIDNKKKYKQISE